MPHILQGIGLEAEARDLNYGRSGAITPGEREDTAEGGVIYSWPRYRYFRPYAKFMMGYGNADEQNIPFNEHWTDSRTITIMGGGVDYRVHGHIWVRADYEYQSWPDFFKFAPVGVPPVIPPAGKLNPQGFTIGAMYHFNHPHYH
jgi:opacity protein-like surface antigen